MWGKRNCSFLLFFPRYEYMLICRDTKFHLRVSVNSKISLAFDHHITCGGSIKLQMIL